MKSKPYGLIAGTAVLVAMLLPSIISSSDSWLPASFPQLLLLLVLIVLLVTPLILLVNLFIGVVEAKGCTVATWQLWLIGIVLTPLAVALYAAILSDRGMSGHLSPPARRPIEESVCERVDDEPQEEYGFFFKDESTGKWL